MNNDGRNLLEDWKNSGVKRKSMGKNAGCNSFIKKRGLSDIDQNVFQGKSGMKRDYIECGGNLNILKNLLRERKRAPKKVDITSMKKKIKETNKYLHLALDRINCRKSLSANQKNENESETKIFNRTVYDVFPSKHRVSVVKLGKKSKEIQTCTKEREKYSHQFLSEIFEISMSIKGDKKTQAVNTSTNNLTINENSFSYSGEPIDNDKQDLMKQIESLKNQLIMKTDIEKANKISIEELLKELRTSEQCRMEMHKYIQNLRGNMRVFCRVKPQMSIDAKSCLNYPEKLVLSDVNDITVIELKGKQYHFDKVFTESSSQAEIFEEVKPFIQSSLDGEDICLFAYGATGTGKTYTMQGPIYSQNIITEFSGILPRAADFIFEELGRKARIENNRKLKVNLFFSAFEIYNEGLFDLLNNRTSLTFSKSKVQNVIQVPIEAKKDIVALCDRASKQRRTESTSFNETSSRSHAVYTIRINYEGTQKINSIINIIDLAGSEKVTADKNLSPEELKKIQIDMGHINKSLVALKRVLNNLCDKKFNKDKITYGDSKLTRILKPFLNVNSKTVMIVNISPEEKNQTSTRDTMNFASEAVLGC